MTQVTTGWRAAAAMMLLGVAGCGEAEMSPGAPVETSPVTIFKADTIVTMNEAQQRANSVAVEAGRIVGIGDFEGVKAEFPGAVIDETFTGKTLVPGLIDPHIHVTLGAMQYALPFVPPWDMVTQDGIIEGLPGRTDFLARLAELEAGAPEGAPLIVYGYHNLVQGDLTRQDLDRISSTRRIVVWHYSSHDFYLNSPAIDWMKLSPSLADEFSGVALDENGELTGRIYEDAVGAVLAYLGPILLSPDHIAKGFAGMEQLIANSGVTTVAELGYGIFNRQVEDSFIAAHYSPDDPYKLYLVPEHRAFKREFGDRSVEVMLDLRKERAEALAKILPQVKLFTDAAFYSQTMKMQPPGYTGGQSEGTDGLWVTEPEDIAGTMRPYWQAGLDIRIHSNGDAAQSATLAAFSDIRAERSAEDQVLVLEHAGMMRPEHIAEAARLGAGVSAASHYVYYMGQDFEQAIGDRVQFMTPLASVSTAGVPATLHSDAPLAPLQPLRAASVHLTRATRQGGVSTPAEKLSPWEAMEAITIDAAWALGLDDEIGSIETGKRADFTVLDRNPLTTPAEGWPDIGIWGVVLDGQKHPLEEQGD